MKEEEKEEEEPSFDRFIHISSPNPTNEQRLLVEEFRRMLSEDILYKKHIEWATDSELLRFLIARHFKINSALELIRGALKWREQRKPNEIEKSLKWPQNMARESETGKIYCPGYDRWGRSIVVLDNTVQNTNSIDDQMTFLAWNLEFAIKMMEKDRVDKYLVFMHLENFSFRNIPPISSTTETIHMVCNCYPERLGHCIAYQPPAIFGMVYHTIKRLLDPKTVSKLIFISGDVSEGSVNDLKMKEVVGEGWKRLTGATEPVHARNSSPGYIHGEYWPTVMERLEKWKERERVRVELKEEEMVCSQRDVDKEKEEDGIIKEEESIRKEEGKTDEKVNDEEEGKEEEEEEEEEEGK
jgi:hypothetical protein